MYEGRSLLWAAENVFTHPTSRLVGVDIELRPQLVANVRMSGQANRITTILGSSRTELRKLDVSSFDVLYVDGSHESADVLSDAVQGYALVKDGGLMIFDDYGWVGPWVGRRGQLLPDTLRPKASIDAFIAAYRYGLAVVESGYQMILRKRVDPCRQAGLEGPCSPFGQYAFDWMSERLVRPGPPAALVPISPAETELVESFLRSEGRVEGGDKAFAALVWRLELDLSDGR